MISARLLPLAVIGGLAFWPLRRFTRGYWSRRTPVDISVGFLLLMVLITLWVLIFPEMGYHQVYRLLSGILLFYALINWGDSYGRLRLIIVGLCLACLFLAFMAPFSVEWATFKMPFLPASLYERFTLLVSDTVNSNVFAGSLVILLPVPLGLLVFGRKVLGRLELFLYGATSLLVLVVLVLTQSRGAWLALVGIFLFLLILLWRWGWLFSLGVLIAGAVILLRSDLKQVLDFLATSGTVTSMDGRLEIWSRAIYMIRDFPITGVGMGAFGSVAETMYPFFYYEPGTINHAHNLFLQITVDLGVPGLIAWVAVLFGVSFTAWRVYRIGKETQDKWITGLGAGFLCSQFALALHGVVDSVTWGIVRSAPIVWAIWGATVCSGLYFARKASS